MIRLIDLGEGWSLRKVVAYVAGPYRAETVNGIVENIQRARKAAVELWRMG